MWLSLSTYFLSFKLNIQLIRACILFLILLFFTTGLNAQSCSQTFTASGQDDDPTILTIVPSDITCTSAAITGISLCNAAGNLTNSFCGTWYDFTLAIDGVDQVTGCAMDLNGISIPTNFTSLSIRSADLDVYSDAITIVLDLCVSFSASCTAPSATSSINSASCPLSYYVDVAVSALGDGSPNITDGTNNWPVNSLGTTTVGPFASGSFVNLTLEHGTNPVCDLALGNFSFFCGPANDDCLNAISLTVDAMNCDGLFINGDNTGATAGTDPFGTCFVGGVNGVWFNFMAPASGAVSISTDFLGGTSADTEIAVFDDCLGTTELACDQDGGTLVNFNSIIPSLSGLTPWATYYILVSGWNGTEGSFCIQINELSCTKATHANYSADFSNCPTSTSVSFEVITMGSATSINVLNNLGGTNPPPITSTGVYQISNLPITGNVEIYLDPNDNVVCQDTIGPFTLACPPQNDTCTTALDITGDINTGTNLYSNTTYADDGLNPMSVTGCNTFNSWCNTNPCFRDVWYSVTPSLAGCIGYLSVSTLGSTFDTKLAIYSDCGTVISANDDYHGSVNGFTSLTTAAVENGETYYIQIGGYNSIEFGDISLNMRLKDIQSVVPSNAGNISAHMECTHADGWTHYIDTLNNYLVMSIQKNGEDTGWLPMTTGVSFSQEAFQNSSNVGTNNCNSFYAIEADHLQMFRTWNVNLITQPTNPVLVRAYYTDGDYTNLDLGYNGWTGNNIPGHSSLEHYQILNGEANFNINSCHLDDNGGNASYQPLNFTYGSPACMTDHYAEFSISDFTGGGGTGYVESCVSDLTLSGNQSSDNDYEAGNTISSSQFILSPAIIDYDAVTEIHLMTGFEVQQGATFHAFLDGCGGAQ